MSSGSVISIGNLRASMEMTTRLNENHANERGNKMDKYQCGPCGYIYDPEVGDPDSGIAPGTAFEDIPDDWTCPVCGVSKDMFEKI